MIRMAVLQHVPFEGPAAIAEWAASRGAAVTVIHLYKHDPLPALDTFDMLTIMGGPMSVNDENTIPWLASEIALVRAAIAAKKVVLGVCLGAQMIAKALGAKVYPGPAKEIGWFPVWRTHAAATMAVGLPETFTPFHWHGETFDLPEDAVLLASTDAVRNQLFAVGNRVLGLQFHMEATPDSVRDLLDHASDDIGSGLFEQQPSVILKGIGNCAIIRPMLDTVLDRLTALSPRGT